MSKYHIKKDGTPGLCKATKNCPLGGADEHFESAEEAQAYSDKLNKEKTQKIENRVKTLLSSGSPDIYSESTEVKRRLLEEGSYSLELASDNSKDISDLAKSTYAKLYGKELTKEHISEQKNALNAHLDEHPEDDIARTNLAYYSKLEITETTEYKAETEILKTANDPDGGATWNPHSKKSPISGFCHSPYPEHSKVIDPENAEETVKAIKKYIVEHDNLLKEKDHYIGIWNDPETGKVYLDVSVTTFDAVEARSECKKNDQIGYFDLQRFESVNVDSNATSGQG